MQKININNRKLINTIAILFLRIFGTFSKYLDFRQTELPSVAYGNKWSLRY